MAGRTDPDVPYRFFVDFHGIREARFNEISGLKTSTAINSVREGGNNVFEYAMIEGQTYDDVVIKKGFFSVGSLFYEWMRTIHIKTKPIQRETVEIVMLNDKYDEVGRFNLYNAFPVQYEGPSLNATAKDIAFESIKLHYDYFEYHPGNAVAGLIDAVATSAIRQLDTAAVRQAAASAVRELI